MDFENNNDMHQVELAESNQEPFQPEIELNISMHAENPPMMVILN